MYKLLYVDDEEQSLKYFKKAFGNDFDIITAANASDAFDMLEIHGDEVGVLIVDQRMPEETGVELLTRVRSRWPGSVRILTTAYSDMDAVVDAVNSGAIFRYINKPWELDELKGDLQRAMEFFIVQHQRDTLIREKLSVLQRLMISDRVRSFAIMAEGLAHHVRNSLTALATFIDHAPAKLKEETTTLSRLKSPEFWEDIWSIAHRESNRLKQMVHDVASLVVEKKYSFNDQLSLKEIVASYSRQNDASISVDISENLPSFHGDGEMVRKFFDILIGRLARMHPDNTITVRAHDTVEVWGTEGIKINIIIDGAKWDDDVVASLFTAFAALPDNPSDMGVDILSAYFIVHHHGGDIVIHKSTDQGPGFEILLPLDPEKVQESPLNEDFMEKVFTLAEPWSG